MTIEPQWMAVALLIVSWVTALMIALDAGIDLKAWLGRLSAWRKEGLLEAKTTSTLASLEIEQRARAFDDGGIGFFERRHTSHVSGGPVELAGGERLEVSAADAAQVWVSREALERAGACASPAQFAELFEKAKGTQALRTVRVEVSAGQAVFLAGRREGTRFVASLVATVDPRLEARRRVLLNLGVIAVNLAWAALGTTLALWPPAFGTVSIVGAMVLFAHFLGMTPLAIDARERSKTPAERDLLGEWRPPSASPQRA